MTESIAGANSRSGRAALDVLSAAVWSSKDADRMLARLRPADFHPLDDTIAAAVLHLRRRGITWDEPTPVVERLRGYQQLWRDRHDAGHFGLPDMPTPVEDLVDPDRTPLRFAGRALQTCRIYDVVRHIPTTDVDTAATAVGAGRRREVSEATMRTVHRILADPPPGSSRAERQEAIGRVLRGYRRDMNARHLYPAGTQHGTKSAGR
jgi:hypothetical protein